MTHQHIIPFFHLKTTAFPCNLVDKRFELRDPFKEKRSYPVDALKSLFDDVYGRINMRKLTLSQFRILSRPL